MTPKRLNFNARFYIIININLFFNICYNIKYNFLFYNFSSPKNKKGKFQKRFKMMEIWLSNNTPEIMCHLCGIVWFLWVLSFRSNVNVPRPQKMPTALTVCKVYQRSQFSVLRSSTSDTWHHQWHCTPPLPLLAITAASCIPVLNNIIVNCVFL